MISEFQAWFEQMEREGFGATQLQTLQGCHGLFSVRPTVMVWVLADGASVIALQRVQAEMVQAGCLTHLMSAGICCGDRTDRAWTLTIAGPVDVLDRAATSLGEHLGGVVKGRTHPGQATTGGQG